MNRVETEEGKRTAVAGASALLVAAPDAARLCGISRATWHRLRSAGKIGPAPIRLGGRVLWRVEELREWVRCGCPPRREWEALHAQRNGRP